MMGSAPNGARRALSSFHAQGWMKERGWQGRYFRQNRKLWRVLETDGVVYDPDQYDPDANQRSR